MGDLIYLDDYRKSKKWYAAARRRARIMREKRAQSGSNHTVTWTPDGQPIITKT